MNKQILVVDDSPSIHTLVKALLADEPVDIQSATDPAYGLTLAASMKPDLLLLDVDMPQMDGYEFCRRMKADASLWTVPVIFLSAKGSSDQKVRGLELGAVDYVSKPFSNGELLARVRSALRTRSVIASLESRELVDPLTGLGNERMFNSRLRAEVSERARAPKPLTCAAMDLDGFTSVNQLYGQPFGDLLLKKVSQTLRETYREEDIVCRMRADDFAVLMPATTLEAAVELAREFKMNLSRAGFEYRGSRVPVTCSVGLADAQGADDRALYERAVQALQQTPGHRSDTQHVWPAGSPSKAA